MEYRNFYGRIRGKSLKPAQQRYLSEDLPGLSVAGITREENPKRTFLDINAFNSLILDKCLGFLRLSSKILASFIVKCGDGSISYEISEETLKLILNSFINFFSIIF